MLKSFFKGLSLFSILAVTSNITHATEEVGEVTLGCTTEICSLDSEISKYLKHTNLFEEQDIQFYLQSGAAIIDSKLLSTFILEQNYIEETEENVSSFNSNKKDSKTLSNNGIEVNTIKRNNISPNMLGSDEQKIIQDLIKRAKAKKELSEKLKYVNNIPEVKITVTQGLIDSNDRAKNFIVSAIMAIPSGKIAALIAQVGKKVGARELFESLAAAYLSDLIYQAMKGNNLEVGDILVFKNGQMTIIKNPNKKEGDTGNNNRNGNRGGSGGGNEGGHPGSGGAAGGISLPGDTPIRVCTSISGNGSTSCYWIYL